MKGKQFNKIKIDYGNNDYYKFYKSRYIKSGNKLYNVSSTLYLAILSEYNKGVISIILDHNNDYKIPHGLGTIGLRKYKPKLETDNGKIIVNKLPIDPVSTRKLWDSNPEAKEKKIYVRFSNKHSGGYVFKMYWFRGKAIFRNKSIYTIKFKRDFTRLISQRIQEKSIDAFLI